MINKFYKERNITMKKLVRELYLLLFKDYNSFQLSSKVRKMENTIIIQTKNSIIIQYNMLNIKICLEIKIVMVFLQVLNLKHRNLKIIYLFLNLIIFSKILAKTQEIILKLKLIYLKR